MMLCNEYMKHRSGYAFGAGVCWIRIYHGERSGDAPIVLCEKLAGTADEGELSAQIAAEVIAESFPEGLPDLPRPLLWIEHRPSLRGHGRGRYFLISFASYRPLPAGAGFNCRLMLGGPSRRNISPEEVAALIGEGPG